MVNSNPFKYFAKDIPVRVAQDFVLEHLDGVVSFEMVVDAGRGRRHQGSRLPAQGRGARSRCREDRPSITRAISIVDILRQMNRALNGGGNEYYKLPDTKQGVAQELLLYTMGLPQGMDVNDRMSVKNDALRITLVSTITDSNAAVATVERIEQLAQRPGPRRQGDRQDLLYQGMNGYVVDRSSRRWRRVRCSSASSCWCRSGRGSWA